MRKKRKVFLVCQEQETVNLVKLAQHLEIKFLISSNLEEALRIIKRCGEDYLSGVIADFNLRPENDTLALEIIAHSGNFYLPTLIFLNQENKSLINDIAIYLKFSQVKKYPILKSEKVDWEKAIYELNFHMTR